MVGKSKIYYTDQSVSYRDRDIHIICLDTYILPSTVHTKHLHNRSH